MEDGLGEVDTFEKQAVRQLGLERKPGRGLRHALQQSYGLGTNRSWGRIEHV